MFSTAPLSGSPKLPDGIPPGPLIARTCENKRRKTKSHCHSHARVPPQHHSAPLYGIPKLTDGTLPGLQTLLGSFGLIPAPNPCLKIAVCHSHATVPPQHLFMAFRN